MQLERKALPISASHISFVCKNNNTEGLREKDASAYNLATSKRSGIDTSRF